MSFRRALPWILLAAGILGVVLGYSGYAMEASFSVADPPGAPPRDATANLHLAVTLLSLLIAAGAISVLIDRALRRRHR